MNIYEIRWKMYRTIWYCFVPLYMCNVDSDQLLLFRCMNYLLSDVDKITGRQTKTYT